MGRVLNESKKRNELANPTAFVICFDDHRVWRRLDWTRFAVRPDAVALRRFLGAESRSLIVSAVDS
jgi:hypothetical protein